MEKDLNKIKRLGRSRERENLEFRVFLKGWDKPQEELDDRVRELYHQFAAEMDCTTCANCCREMEPVLDETDVERLANATGMSILEFEERFLRKDETWGHLTFKEKPCPFLRGNTCQFHDARPKECYSYPYLLKPFFAGRLLGVVENYSVCPIVFNVYEALKRELWR